MTAIGIDVGGTTVKMGAVSQGAQVVFRESRPSPRDPAAMVRLLGDLLEQAWARFPGAPAAVCTAGDIEPGGLVTANQLGFSRAPIGPGLLARLGRPVPLENDAVCALLAERRGGALQTVDNAVMITLGTGVGGAVLTEGRVYRGRDGYHGDIGHMLTHAGGRACSCGKRGCWEAYASATALSQQAGGMPPRDVIRRVRAGEMQALWAAWLDEVALGVVSLLSIFYPQAVVIGGGLADAGDVVVGGIRDRVTRDPGYRLYGGGAPLVPARFGNDAGILGAAALAEENAGNENAQGGAAT